MADRAEPRGLGGALRPGRRARFGLPDAVRERLPDVNGKHVLQLPSGTGEATADLDRPRGARQRDRPIGGGVGGCEGTGAERGVLPGRAERASAPAQAAPVLGRLRRGGDARPVTRSRPPRLRARRRPPQAGPAAVLRPAPGSATASTRSTCAGARATSRRVAGGWARSSPRSPARSSISSSSTSCRRRPRTRAGDTIAIRRACRPRSIRLTTTAKCKPAGPAVPARSAKRGRATSATRA